MEKGLKYNQLNNLQKRMVDLYLEWVNDHLTLDHIADYYGFDIYDMDMLISIGRKLHRQTTN